MVWLPLMAHATDIVLARKPELGETAVYRVVRKFKSEEDSFSLEWTDEVTLKVSQRDSLGNFVQTVSWKPMGQKLDDKELPAPENVKAFVYSLNSDPRGFLISRDADPDDTPLQFRYARSWSVPLPGTAVANGAVWDTKFTGDTGLPGVPCVSRITLNHIEAGVAYLDVRFWEKKPESPLKAVGSASVDVENGQLRELHLDYQNAPIPGGEGDPVPMHLDWVRVDLLAKP